MLPEDIEILEDLLIEGIEGRVAVELEEIELAEAEVEIEEVRSFQQVALQSAKDFVSYVWKNATLTNTVMGLTGVTMIYELIKKHAEVAGNGEKKIKLDSRPVGK